MMKILCCGLLVASVFLSLLAAAPADAQTPGGTCTTAGQTATTANSNGYPNILYCNGTNWVAASLPLGNSVTSCASGTTGVMRWTGTILQVCNGTAWVNIGVNAGAYGAGATYTIDWGNGSVQASTNSCGAFTFLNMQDGGTYLLTVEGTTAGTCSFTHAGLTFRLPTNHGQTINGTLTLYQFTRRGTNVFVTWQTGY